MSSHAGDRFPVAHLGPQSKRAGQQRVTAADLVLALRIGNDDGQIARRRKLMHDLTARPARAAAIFGHDCNRNVVPHALADRFPDGHPLRAMGQPKGRVLDIASCEYGAVGGQQRRANRVLRVRRIGLRAGQVCDLDQDEDRLSLQSDARCAFPFRLRARGLRLLLRHALLLPSRCDGR